jgi:hypothetical protein
LVSGCWQIAFTVTYFGYSGHEGCKEKAKEPYCMRFQVLMIASMKMTAFWHVMPCILMEVYWCFTLMIEAVHTYETSVCFHETAQHYIPESCHLQNHIVENNY